MRMTSTRGRSHAWALSAIAVSIANTFFARQVYAQEDQVQATAEMQAAPAAEAEVETIVVTGSRIRKAESASATPVMTLDREAIEHQGLTSVADVLQRISTSGAALNAQFNNGGDGSAGISLRNLGSERTLVLVNGKRWTTGIGGSVDLNTLPISMVERIDVLKGGASSIYGSDAIAGVVNIITKDKFDGVEFHTYQGQFAGDNDGRRQMYDFTIGGSNDKASIVFGTSFVKEQPVMAGDREISANRNAPYNPGYSGTGAPGSFVDPSNNTKYVIDAVTGAVRPYVGRDGSNPGDGYFTADDNYLLTPQERTTAFVQGSYKINDYVTFKSDAMVNERISEQLLAAMPVTGMTLDADSYYNPTNPNGYYAGTDGAVAGTQRDMLKVARRFTESGGRSFVQNDKTLHFNGGFEGAFDVADRAFHWDANFGYNKTDEVVTTRGLFNTDRLSQAYGPSYMGTDGVLHCGTAAAPIAGCTPINPLGPTGSISKDALDYVSFNAHDTSSVESFDYTLNLTGDIVELPAGMMSFATGFERREESGQFEPDAFIAAGYSTGNAAQPTAGAYSLNEIYAELSIPVLSDLPFAQKLTIDIAGRFSDYSNFGNTNNGKVSFEWKPINDLLVRGNYAEGFRAPSINDMFMGSADSYETYADPCATDYPGGPARYCADHGIPATNNLNGAYEQDVEPATWTSNTKLQPETSKSKTIGFVFSPSSVKGLDVSLDWWSIKIDDAITRLEANYVATQCYEQNVASMCSLITRDPAYPGTPYLITHLEMPMYNLASYDVEGYDMTVNYRFPMTSVGRFAVNWDSTYTTKWDRKGSAESEIEHNVGKELGNDPYWRIRSNLALDWSLRSFGASWMVRYYSALDETCTFDGADAQAYCSDPGKGTNELGQRFYHDAQFRWEAPWNGTVSLGMQNVFDKDPPASLTAKYNNFDPQYPTPGRFVYMEYRQRF